MNEHSIVGSSHRSLASQTLLRRIKPDDHVFLKRELGNIYDSNATRVLLVNSSGGTTHVAYVGRQDAKTLADGWPLGEDGEHLIGLSSAISSSKARFCKFITKEEARAVLSDS